MADGDPKYMLVSLERMTDTLNFGVEDADKVDPLKLAIGDASFMVIRRCRRIFGTYTATKTFDLPYGPYLAVPDLQEVAHLHVGDVELVLNTDFDLQPENLTDADAAYHQLRRLVGNDLGSWWSDGQTGTRWRGGQVEATWGLPTPDTVVRVTEIVTVRLWDWRNILYGARGGNTALGMTDSPSGLWTAELNDMLQDYMLPAPVSV